MDKAFIAFANLTVIIPYSVMVVIKPDGRKISPGLLAVTSPLLLFPVIPWIVALVNHPDFPAFWALLRTCLIPGQLDLNKVRMFSHFIFSLKIEFLPVCNLIGLVAHCLQV